MSALRFIPYVGIGEDSLLSLARIQREMEGYNLAAIDHYETDLTHYPEYGTLQPLTTTETDHNGTN